jgi:hypothetical protein
MPVQVDIVPGPITIGANGDFEVYELSDNIHDFEANPTKLIDRPWDNPGGTIKSVAIPLITNINQEFDIENFKRRLYVNQLGSWGTASGNKQFLKIQRPLDNGTPKKAYIHSIIYSAYDFNDMLPYFDDTLLGAMADSTPLTVADMKVDNVFGTNKGLITNKTAGVGETDANPAGLHARQALLKRSVNYTTAHYPLTRPYGSTQEREFEITAMERLGQAGLRSSIRGGLLPSDIFKNNFKLKIGGMANNTPTEQEAFLYDLFVTGNNKNTYNNDNIIPAYNNEIDIAIPDDVDWLGVEVSGLGWAHGIEWKQMNPSNVKGVYQAVEHLITFVQMPVKVSIAIKYV